MAKEQTTDLRTMLGAADTFEAQGKKYRVIPLKLKEVQQFFDDNVIVNEQQIFNLVTDEAKASTDKWLSTKVTRLNGEPFSLAGAMDDDWDLDDLKECLRKLSRISG